MPTPATRKDPLANPEDCPYCGQWVRRNPEWSADMGHIDDCPALHESWHSCIERIGDSLASLVPDDDWREQLRQVAGEVLAIADWPTKFKPGSLSEAVHLGDVEL